MSRQWSSLPVTLVWLWCWLCCLVHTVHYLLSFALLAVLWLPASVVRPRMIPLCGLGRGAGKYEDQDRGEYEDQDRDEDDLECEYDSTWEDEEYGCNSEQRMKAWSCAPRLKWSRRNIRAARDMQRYRHYYTENKQMPNLNFYLNKIPSEPDGVTIEDFHRKWRGNYVRLEQVHSFIQWLFPLQEPGVNFYAVALTPREIEEFRKNDEAKRRLVESYELMLDFYGIELLDKNTGKVQQAENWKERFYNLNVNTHNNLRITRILKCLGELGFEHFQAPLVHFFLNEALVKKTLWNVKQSIMDYFLFSVRNKRERQKLLKFAFMHYMPREEFVWCPRRIQQHLAQCLKQTSGIAGENDKSPLDNKEKQECLDNEANLDGQECSPGDLYTDQPSPGRTNGGSSNTDAFSENEEHKPEATKFKWNYDRTMTTGWSTCVELSNMAIEKKAKDQDNNPNQGMVQTRDNEEKAEHGSEAVQQTGNDAAGQRPSDVDDLMIITTNDDDSPPNKDVESYRGAEEESCEVVKKHLGSVSQSNAGEEVKSERATGEEERNQSTVGDVMKNESSLREVASDNDGTQVGRTDLSTAKEEENQRASAEEARTNSPGDEQAGSHRDAAEEAGSNRTTGEEAESQSAAGCETVPQLKKQGLTGMGPKKHEVVLSASEEVGSLNTVVEDAATDE